MEDNKTMTNEEVVEKVEEQAEEVKIIGVSEEELDGIHETLQDHKEHIEKLYEKVNEKQSLINLKNVDAVGIAKWVTIGIIGVTVAKNEGGFGLDIPFFHIRFGKETK